MMEMFLLLNLNGYFLSNFLYFVRILFDVFFGSKCKFVVVCNFMFVFARFVVGTAFIVVVINVCKFFVVVFGLFVCVFSFGFIVLK